MEDWAKKNLKGYDLDFRTEKQKISANSVLQGNKIETDFGKTRITQLQTLHRSVFLF